MKIYPNPKQPMIHYELEEIELNQMNRPMPRYDHGMIKVTNDEFYIFGGSVSDQGQGSRCNQLWKFDIINLKWEVIEIPGTYKQKIIVNNNDYIENLIGNLPVPRSGHGMVYENINNSIMIFGGSNSRSADGDLNDLWQYFISK
jgi:hypothetical protein